MKTHYRAAGKGCNAAGSGAVSISEQSTIDQCVVGEAGQSPGVALRGAGAGWSARLGMVGTNPVENVHPCGGRQVPGRKSRLGG